MTKSFEINDRVVILDSARENAVPEEYIGLSGELVKTHDIGAAPGFIVRLLESQWSVSAKHLRHADEDAGSWVSLPRLPDRPMLCEVRKLGGDTVFSWFIRGSFSAAITHWRPVDQSAQEPAEAARNAQPKRGAIHAALYGITESDSSGIDRRPAAPALPTPATPAMVRLPRSGEGLMTVAPYLTRRPLWGAQP